MRSARAPSGCGRCRTRNAAARGAQRPSRADAPLPQSFSENVSTPESAAQLETETEGARFGDYAPMVMSEGRSSVIFVVPALTETACSPLDGDTGLAAPPLTEMVPLVTQLGIRTW